MSNLLKFISVTMLMAYAFSVSEARANSITYNPEARTFKGLVNFQPKSDIPFAAVAHSAEVKQIMTVHGLQGRKHGQPRKDEHPTNANGHTIHGDQDDDSEDNTSDTSLPGIKDENDWEAEDTITPPTVPGVPSDIPVIVSPSAIPLPAAVWLFLSGIIGLAVAGQSRRR